MNNITIEKETAAITELHTRVGVLIAMSMNADDKNSLPLFTSDNAWLDYYLYFVGTYY
jgi:hypothetical protein